MSPRVCSMAIAGALALPSTAAVAAVQEAQPASSPIALGQGACTVQPRSVAELQTAVANPFPEASVAAIATSAALLDQIERGSAPSTGQPAEPAIVEAVTETVGEFYAYLVAGDQLAAVSLATDDYVRSQMVVSADSAGEQEDGAGSPPPELVAGSRLSVRDVQQLADDRVGALVEIALPSGESRSDYVLLREVDGQYLVDGVAEGVSSTATPTS